ncbi:MAG: type II secretion system F family protein [Acidimicrobiales bacterium]|nr:type II secretion system F family protein [Acidimicrobiales bacterium]
MNDGLSECLAFVGSRTSPVVPVAAVLLASAAVATSVTWAIVGDRRTRALARISGRTGSEVPCWFVDLARWLDLRVDVARTWPAARTAGLSLALVLAVTSPATLVVVVAAGFGAATVQRSRRTGSTDDVDAVALVEALLAPLGAGASLEQTVRRIGASASGSIGVGCGRVAAAVSAGAGLQAALDDWVDELGDERVALVVNALAVAGGSGGSQTRALVRVGQTLRDRDALEREVHALGSQARMSAFVLAVMPVGFTGVVALADQRIAGFLFGTVVGWGCIGLGSALDAVGWFWMKRLTGRVS